MKESIKSAILNRRMLICVFTGFSSGLPLYILMLLVPAWLTVSGVSIKTIGFFTLVGIPYTCKFLWAPLIDSYIPPFLGRRRGWMLITQLLVFASIVAIGYFHPEISVMSVAWMATAIAFFGASQDVVLDAYRRELLPDLELGLGNSIHVQAFRISQLVPGSLALILAEHISWPSVFWMVAAFMLVGIVLTFCIVEIPIKIMPPRTFRAAVVEPFKDFFGRFGVILGLQILLFVLFYKLGDSMATALTTTFYNRGLGFSLSEIGLYAKNAGLWSSIAGGMIGGLLMTRMGINRALWIFGILQWVVILGFVVMAEIGHNTIALFIFIAIEAFGMGMGAAALVAYIASVTNPTFAATQFALLTALTAMPRNIFNSFSGIFVEYMGWTNYFLFCMLIAIPGMLLLFKVAPWNEPKLELTPEETGTR